MIDRLPCAFGQSSWTARLRVGDGGLERDVSERQVTGGLRILLESLGKLVHSAPLPLSESWSL